jgi:hypothetical protein
MNLLHLLELLVDEINLPLHLVVLSLGINEETILGSDDFFTIRVLGDEDRDKNLLNRTS